MRKRKNKLWNLINLYFEFSFQKSTIIIGILSILIMIFGIYFVSNPWLIKSEYLEASKDYHFMFLSQSLLIIQIFNSIIVTTIVISLTIQSYAFDILFISYIPRKKICLSKIIVLYLLCLLLCGFEILLIYSIGFIRFSNFTFSYEVLNSYFFLFLSLLFECMVSLNISTIFPILFTPMVFLFVSLVLKIICNNFDIIYKGLSTAIPLVKINYMQIIFEIKNPVLTILWIILFALLYISIYEIKDIRI